jgi:F0F1-type ATP synthase delta subunit
LDFLLLILKKARVGNILNIATAYARMYRIENHLKTVTVYTEKTLISQQQKDLVAMLSEQLPGETIELRPRTFPGAIGGFALRYDDYFYDATIGNQLRNFHLKLESNHYDPQL